MKYALIAIAALLSACITGPQLTEPKKEIVYVDRPVAMSCVPTDFYKNRPVFTDNRGALLAAPNKEERYKLVGSNWELKEVWISKLETQINLCLTKNNGGSE